MKRSNLSNADANKMSRSCSFTSSVTQLRSMQEIQSISQTSVCLSNQGLELPEGTMGIVDLVDLASREEDTLLKYMRARYLRKEFYTWAGQTLLAVHPYQNNKHYEGNNADVPSINSVVHKVWFKLGRNVGKTNQAIVITGESGSGKTYTACLAMKYISTKAQDTPGNPFENILWQAWSSVPLLSAFGNALTTHNHNSSRFGKLLQLQVTPDDEVKGAFIKVYMLEKSRVAGPNPNDGNFHIFRQILDSLDAETLSFLYLDNQQDYRIAPRGGPRSTYTETVKALEILNITELDKILIILSVILNLGNVEFDCNGETFTISTESQKFASNVCNLLHLTRYDLDDILCNVQFCMKNVTRRNTIYKSACTNREECEERRNCLMKYLYNQLFHWLVHSINLRTYAEGDFKHLGLLDIYGFEAFDFNTFEQLCINYANERLQQYFMANYLVEKQHELISEGFSLEPADISDYSKRIALIDDPVQSIFALLNEECAVKRFNNDLFINTRLTETLRGHEYFMGPLNDLNTTFSIRHYADVVKYDTKTMLCKNRDKVPEDVINFLKQSNFEFLRELIGTGCSHNGKSLVTNFKKSLDELMGTLNECDVHFVKCLKPNPYKLAEFFDEDFFKEQLAVNGIHDVLKLDYQKFSIRINKEVFANLFPLNLYEIIEELLANEIQHGRNSVYMTERTFHTLERMKYLYHSTFARRIQNGWCKYITGRRNAACKIQRFYRRIQQIRGKGDHEMFIDVSKQSSDISLKRLPALENIRDVTSTHKIEQFLKNHRFDVNFEGDRLSLMLEKTFNNLRMPPFHRVLFCGDRIVSYNRLAEIPVRLHINKTCIRYSHLLPKSEMPKGLTDIFK